MSRLKFLFRLWRRYNWMRFGLCAYCQKWHWHRCDEGLYVDSLIFEGEDIGGGPTIQCACYQVRGRKE